MLPRIYRKEADKRKHQIITLKVFNDNVTEVVEGSEYKISFKAGGVDFVLQVILSTKFPEDKPVIKISPVIFHPWVNPEGEVTAAPGLVNFTELSDLGRVVQAVIREFEKNPPPLLSDHSHNAFNSTAGLPIPRDDVSTTSYQIKFPTVGVGSSSFSPPTAAGALTTVFNTNRSSIFPKLNELSLSELKCLNESEDWQMELVDEHPCISEQNKVIDKTITIVEELAENNLAKQEVLEKLKTNVEDRLIEIEKLAFENERLHGQYLAMSEKYSPRNIQLQLKLAAHDAENESERVAEAFLNGELEVDAFLTSYIKCRTLCQMRKTKEEKLCHQLDKLEKARY